MTEQLNDRGQDQRYRDQSRGAVSEDLLGLVPAAFAQHDGGPGSSAHADQGRKGGDGHDDGEGDAHAGQSAGAHIRQVADVHAVHHIIENIDDLGRDSGKCQAEQKLSDTAGSEIHLFYIFLIRHK